MTVSFAKEKEQRVSSISEGLELLQRDYGYTSTPCELSSLGIDEKYQVHQNGRTFQPTEWAFKNFLRSLGIPYHYGMKIPNDLLDTTVTRLKAVVGRPVRLLVREDTLINVVPANYNPPSVVAVLGLFVKSPIKSLFISDRGIRLSTDSLVEVAPEKNDVIHVGCMLRGSETGGPFPFAFMRTHRLACGNDAIARPEWGVAKWDRRIRNDGFDAFRMSVEHLLQSGEALVPALKALPERTLDVREFRHLWLQTSRVVGGSATDVLFNVDETTRKQFANVAKAKIEQDTELNAYVVFNALSQCGRDLGFSAGAQMATIAGQMLRKN